MTEAVKKEKEDTQTTWRSEGTIAKGIITKRTEDRKTEGERERSYDHSEQSDNESRELNTG